MVNLKQILNLPRGLILAGGLVGILACWPQDPSINDSGNNNPDGGYSDSSSYDGGSNSNSDYDGGSPDGSSNDGGNQGPIILKFETRDNISREPKTVFQVGEDVRFYGKAEDPNCTIQGTCGNTHGVKACYLEDTANTTGTLTPNVNGEVGTANSYGTPATINTKLKCKNYAGDFSEVREISFLVNN